MYQTKEIILSAVEALMKEIPCDRNDVIKSQRKERCENCPLGANNCAKVRSIRHNLINDLKTK